MENTENKVNIKARIDRHLRIVRATGLVNSGKTTRPAGMKFVLFLIIFILPIYPSLANYLYSTSEYDFYRGYIDESSILESYYLGELGDSTGGAMPIIESEDAFLSVNTILGGGRDLSGSNEVVSYEVRPNDNVSIIASEFGISVESILWANDMSSSRVLKPGEILRIPPVSGVLHSVKSGESISSIAKKYDIGESVIKNQNNIKDGDIIKIGQTLIIPGAKQIVVAPVISSAGSSSSSSSSSSSNNSGGGYNFANSANSSMTTDRGSYKLVRRQPAHSFAWGNCTWYVSQYKNVTWGGNANQWMSNARAKGISTGSNPSVGAIVQFSGTGYNPRYGHVGIVMEVYDSYIIVSDMNYRRINEVTYRRVPTNDRSIDGYIYID